ncbi:MAG: hypothetical protein U0768_16900 [Anaerolineae bacterium]
MKKAAQLQVTLTLDGPSPATGSSHAIMGTLQTLLSQVAGKYPALTVTVKSIKKGDSAGAAPSTPTAATATAAPTGKSHAKPAPAPAKSAPPPVHLRLWVAGEDEPAHNFAASAVAAVRDMLAQLQPGTSAVKIKVQTIEEDANYDDEDDWIAADTGA